jgi:hypothetical protein
MNPATEVIYLHVDARGVSAEAELNGFPLLRAHLLPEDGAEAAAQQFLVPGENELVLRVEPGSRPSVAGTEQRVLTPPADALAVAQLVLYPDGVPLYPANGKVLCEAVWSPSGAGAEVFPIERRAVVSLGAAFGRWSWQDAPVLTLDDALVAEARAALEALGTAMWRGPARAYKQLVALQASESRRAYPAWDEAEQAAFLDRLAASYQRAPEPGFRLEAERHDFRLVAGGRVLQCVDDDFRGSLRLVDPAGGSDMRSCVYFARHDGALRVVR